MSYLKFTEIDQKKLKCYLYEIIFLNLILPLRSERSKM